MPFFTVRGPVALPSGYDSATNDWITAVVGAGGAVSDIQKSLVDALIAGLKTDSLFPIIDRLWVYGGENVAQQAGIDVVNRQTHTVYGAVTLSASGYTGDNAHGIDTNLPLDTGGIHYTQDSATFGCYINNVVDDGLGQMGVAIGNNARMQQFIPASNEMRVVINSGNVNNVTATSALGLWIVTRTTANDVAVYRNGVSVYTNNADASTGVPTGSFGVLGRHDGAGDTWQVPPTANRACAAWIGGGMSPTQAANFSSRINTYMTAWGINTY
jgi:hypothetical protein